MREQLKAEAERLRQLGIEQFQLGQFEAALQAWQQALTLYQELQDFCGEGAILGGLGVAYKNLGDYATAIDYHQQHLKIAREIQDHWEEGRALGNLGVAYKNLGDYATAIDYHQQHLKIAREIQDHWEEGKALGNLGVAYKNLGDYATAIDYHQQHLKISRKIQDPQGEKNALNNLGIIYRNIGDYTKAIEYSQNSLNLAQKIKDRVAERTALANLGIAYDALGNHVQAIEYHQQSLKIAREIKDRKVEETALGNLGIAYKFLGDYAKAIEYHQQGLKIAREIKDRRGEGDILGNLGWTYYDLGDYAKAIEYHQQSLAVKREIRNLQGEGNSLNNLGRTLLKSGDLASAEKALRNGIQIWKSLRSDLNDADKISIFEIQASTYRLLQQALVSQNKTQDALEIAEEGRARAFVDLLAERLFTQSATQFTINPPTLQQIQQIAKEQSATLVEYSILDGANLLLIWLIKPSGEIAFRQFDLQPLRQTQNTSLSDLVIQARESLGVEESLRNATPTTSLETAQPIRHISKPLRQLHQLLIEPIANLLPTDPNAHVIFIPQGSLFLVPFPALQDATGKFLIEQHTILTAPSIQVLELTQKQRQRVETIHELPLQSQNALVVGNPTMPTIPLIEPPQPLNPLPGAEAEAKAIASLLNTQAIIGDKATKIDIVQQMPKARLIHLATHGLLDDIKQLGVPGAIALAPSNNDNGFLTAGEILEMKLNAELIVLSACSSGQGKITGDGVIGLSRSLFAAGAPSVIVSLWSVGDKSTQFLMTEFYQNLQHGMNKAQSLRQAMLTTMQRYRRPKSWAAFTLIGEAI